MDFCRKVSVSGECQPEQVLYSSLCSTLAVDDLFPAQNTEVDVGLEWLSIFVEDCLSSTGNCIPVAAAAAAVATGNVENKSTSASAATKAKPLQQQKPQKVITQTTDSLQKFVVPSKARSKRKRGKNATLLMSNKTKFNPFSSWSSSSDPPLLQQTHWLAESELIVPKKERRNLMLRDSSSEEVAEEPKEEEMMVMAVDEEKAAAAVVQPRRCTHCLAQRTPQWRAGPLGPKTLCNACGVRYKSGRLLPEYRPAKSPTFVSYLHSNSHKKVMEMRTAMLS